MIKSGFSLVHLFSSTRLTAMYKYYFHFLLVVLLCCVLMYPQKESAVRFRNCQLWYFLKCQKLLECNAVLTVKCHYIVGWGGIIPLLCFASFSCMRYIAIQHMFKTVSENFMRDVILLACSL